jgi:hypothetical protein
MHASTIIKLLPSLGDQALIRTAWHSHPPCQDSQGISSETARIGRVGQYLETKSAGSTAIALQDENLVSINGVTILKLFVTTG